LLLFIVVVGAIGVAASILISSMVADVVEDSQVRTGRRSEGLFFAASAFTGKLVSAGGLFFAGLILGMVAFPIAAKPGRVDPHILARLVWTYMPIYVGLSLVAVGFLWFYDIDRRRHEENLRRAQALAVAEAAALAGVPPAL
jgi:Na+/melibiose symporter-like transporter